MMLLKRNKTPELESDQKYVMNCYLRPGGRVCVDAGAGTGKTTVLIETLAETVLRELQGKPSNFNPMERILVVSFGVEASRQLKSRLKERLRDHESAGGILPTNIWRFIETESHIQTIDAFLQALLREIVTEIGLNPSFEISTGLEQDNLVDEIINKIRNDPTLAPKWFRLERAFPNLDYLEYPPENLRDMIWNTHQKAREFCLDVKEVKNQLIFAVKNLIHKGFEPPFTIDALQKLVQQLSNNTYVLTCPDHQKAAMIEHAEDVYNYSLQLANDFGDLLIAFDEQYDAISKKTGKLTYIDVAYLVWQYTFKKGGNDWKTRLQNRFDHIFVDEFQDTNFVQYEIIKSLIRSGPPEKRNHVMFIGDLKQSIYQWRSAEPQIFRDLILSLKQKTAADSIPEGMTYAPLVSNFRSHPKLIDFFNGVFSQLFKDRARGAVSGEVPYEELIAKVELASDDNKPRVHILINPGRTVREWVDYEAQKLAAIIRGILQPNSGILVHEENKTRQPYAGDIVLLFRRKENIPRYVNELRSSGINCAIQTDVSLFGEPEVSLIIDFLDWLANPDSRESITRILRSPIIALSDKTLRYLASKRFFLVKALNDWKPEFNLPEEDKRRLIELLKFREDLRWDREGPKAALIERIIAHGYFDSVVLTSEDGLQAQANLWMLIEVVSSWEEEELLSYRDFIKTLKALRDRAHRGVEKDFPRAILADEKTKDSVKVMTIHAAKGLEFPIVIIPESIVHARESARNERIIRNRRSGIILRPRAEHTYLPSDVQITNVNNNKHISWVGRGDEEAILWLSPERSTETGLFVTDSPIHQNVKNDVAEFWRLLYVAATRAKDHLIFSIGNDDRWEKYEWNSWMRFLRTSLNLIDVQAANGNTSKKVELASKQIEIGIEDLPSVPPPTPAPFLDRPIPNGKNAEYKSGCPSFVPSQINPSEFPIFLECPRRYQYAAIWRTSGLRESSLTADASGAQPPCTKSGKMSADEWGDQVHKALRLWDFSLSFSSDQRLKDYMDRVERVLGTRVRAEIEKALTNFSKLNVGKMAINAARDGRPIHKEEELQALISWNSSFPPILVRGRFDLLFQNEKGDWILVDFKAEKMPPPNSFRDRIYRGQINAYAWLILNALGIKIKKAYLAYVHPNGAEKEVIPDETEFEEQVKSSINSLTLDPQKGLKATPSYSPDGPCSNCPYSRKVGGPCEN